MLVRMHMRWGSKWAATIDMREVGPIAACGIDGWHVAAVDIDAAHVEISPCAIGNGVQIEVVDGLRSAASRAVTAIAVACLPQVL